MCKVFSHVYTLTIREKVFHFPYPLSVFVIILFLCKIIDIEFIMNFAVIISLFPLAPLSNFSFVPSNSSEGHCLQFLIIIYTHVCPSKCLNAACRVLLVLPYS